MTNWSALSHAYGTADDLPALLDALSPDPAHPSWNELWSRVCHQGSVYSTSAPVLPRLLALTRRWSGAQRVMPLSLAGAIVTSRDRAEDFDLEPHGDDIAALADLARETMTARGLERVDFVYLLQAALALEGDELWGQVLDRLEDGEFEGTCPSCDACLVFSIGEDGFFVSDEASLDRPEARHDPIVPAEAGALTGVGARMHRLALDARQPEVAQALSHVFGRAICPSCRDHMAVADAIATLAS